MNFYLESFLLVCCISWTIAAPINLNWGAANAHAIGRFNAVQTNSNSWGVTAGIRNIYTGQNIPFLSRAGSNSHAFSLRQGGPQSWTNTKSNANHRTATGNANAGFSGGRGASHAQTHSQAQSIHLGGGNVLYSNLKVKNTGDDAKQKDNQESLVAEHPSDISQSSQETAELNSELALN